MKYVIPAAAVISLAAGGFALAQTANSGTAHPGTTAHPTTAAGANSTSGAGMATTPNSPANVNTATHDGTAATPSNTTGTALGTNANGTPSATLGSTNGAVNPASPNNGLSSGANSFTEGEARSRIQDKGFGQVTNLKLDNQGIWRGTATKDGKTTNVAMDYKGNVVAQ